MRGKTGRSTISAHRAEELVVKIRQQCFHFFNRRLARSAFAALAGLALSSAVFAGDIESAKQKLERVKVDVENKSWDSISDDIKATQEFLDSVPAAEADPVRKELDALKLKADAGMKEFKSKGIVATAKGALDRAADEISQRPLDAKDLVDKAKGILDSDDAKKFVDADQLAKLKSRADSLGKMAMTKAADTKLDFANQIVKQLDETMAAEPFKGKTGDEVDRAARDVNSVMSRIRGALEGVPATDPRVKAINDKIAAYDKVVKSATGNAMAGEAAAQLANMWKAQQEYFAGWDKETAPPTWEQFSQTISNEMGQLMMPKTVEVLVRMNGWFDQGAVKQTADQYKDDASVKATLAEAHKTQDAAAAKLHAAFNGVLDGAEKAPTPKDDSQRNRADYLADRANMWFKGTPYLEQDVARAKKLDAKWKGEVEGKAAALAEAQTKLTAAAANAWPAMASAMKAEDGFTPDKLDQFKGKTIHIKANNRAGWDYNPAGYDFACQINGMAVAGKFDANVKAAAAAARQQTGQDLPDEAWDLYATVEGPGKIPQRVTATGKVKVDGQQVGTVESEGEKSVDCAVIRIVALHAGPVAVGPGGSSVATGGGAPSNGGPTAVVAGTPVVSGGTSGKLLEHLFELGLCVAAAALVLLKSGAVVAGTPLPSQTGAAVTAPGSDTVSLAGLAVIALGVVWLLAKGIVGDLLPALSLTLAGVCISADWLAARNILPVNLRSTLKGMAIPIAAATVIFGFLHIFVANWYLL